MLARTLPLVIAAAIGLALPGAVAAQRSAGSGHASPRAIAITTTERHVRVTSLQLEHVGGKRIRVRVAFDRAPRRLEQVDVGGDGKGYLGTVVPGKVTGRRFAGHYTSSTRATRLRVLIVFCKPPARASRASRGPRAHAAKGNCTWIATSAPLVEG